MRNNSNIFFRCLACDFQMFLQPDISLHLVKFCHVLLQEMSAGFKTLYGEIWDSTTTVSLLKVLPLKRTSD